MAEGTKVLPCTCQSAYQDKRYGAGKRLHNAKEPKKTSTEWRCTVCKAER